MKKYIIGFLILIVLVLGYLFLVKPHKALIEQAVLQNSDDGVATFSPVQSKTNMDNSAYLVFSVQAESATHQYTQDTIQLVDKKTFAVVKSIPLDIILPNFTQVSVDHEKNKIATIDGKTDAVNITDLTDGTTHTVAEVTPTVKEGSSSYYYQIKSLKWAPQGNNLALIIQKTSQDTSSSCFRFDTSSCPSFREWNKLVLLNLDSGQKQSFLLDDHSSNENDAGVSPDILNWIGNAIYLDRPGALTFYENNFNMDCASFYGTSQSGEVALDTNTGKITEQKPEEVYPAFTKGLVNQDQYPSYCHLSATQDLIFGKLNQTNYTVEYFLYDRAANSLTSLGSYKTDDGFMGQLDSNTLIMHGPYTKTFFLFNITTQKQTQIPTGENAELLAF